jgi:hypothetical protein
MGLSHWEWDELGLGIAGADATPLGDTTEHSDAERVASPDRRFRSD